MRRSTVIAPFSRLALFAATGALGITAFARAASAAEPAAATAPSASAHAATPAPGKGLGSTSGSAAAPTTSAAGTTAKPAPADKKTKDAARKAYSDAEKSYTAADYAAAYAGYSKANQLIPSPHAAYWAAKSLDQSGKVEDAIHGYEALLADPASTKIGEEKLTDARTRLATLKAGQVGEVTVSSAAPGAVLVVDGVRQPGALPVVLKLAPGPHQLTLTAPGFDAKQVDLQVQAGTKIAQVLDLQPHAAPPPPPPPPPLPEIAPAAPPASPEKHSLVPAYVTLGIAAGGAVVGTIFGIKALQNKSDFDKTPNTASADDTERNALIADMAFGVAVTLGVTGIVLLTSGDDGTEAAPKAAKLHLPPKGTFRVLPYVGRGSGGAAARLTF